MTAPWSTTATTYLDGPLEHVVTARVVTAAGATVTDLNVTGGSLTFDAGWAPYAQASVTCATPGVTVDPRLGHRLILSAGYVYPTGVRDVQQVANLALTDARSSRDRRTLALSAHSDEVLVQGSANWKMIDYTVTYPTVSAAVLDLLKLALTPWVPTLNVTWDPDVSPSTVLTNHTVALGASIWSPLEALRDVARADLWCNESRVWQMHFSGSEAVNPSDPLTLSTEGPLTTTIGDVGAGTPAVARIITQSEQTTSLDDWANVVVVEHHYPSGGAWGRIARHAITTTGPHAVSTVGYKAMQLTRPTALDAAGVTAEAASILRRTIRRGNVKDHTCAHSAYWLRPRRSIRTHLEGVTAYEWLTRVTFDLDGSGQMTLSTREPVEDI